MSKKFPIDFGMILFMTSVFGLVIFLFYFQPTRKLPSTKLITPDIILSTTKTYTNDKYNFSFEYPKNWTFFTQEAKENPYTVEFAPVAEGEPKLMTFYGELRVYENVTDFEQWLNTNRNLASEEETAKVVTDINKAYRPDFIKKENIKFSENRSEISTNPTYTLSRTIICPDTDDCKVNDRPIGFTKWIDIYHNNSVIEFYVATYFETSSAIELNKIINSMEFEK